ncbi:MAG: VanZ family protein [Acidobacteriota bacterium]|jgi:VanZ family protein|nr:VanZ family protein [Acidobacteriota bacterium]
MGFLLALSCALILYGTLHPFSFTFGSREESILSLLAASTHSYVGRGDTIANVILFLPFGFFAMQSVFQRAPRPIRLIFIVVSGAALSFGIECAQSCLPGRSVSIYDLLTNTTGALLGAVLGWKDWRGKLPKLRADNHPPAIFPVLLLGAWLGGKLFPFVPALKTQNIKNALKPLFFGEFVLSDALWSFIAAMVVCRLAQAFVRPGRLQTALTFLPLGVIAVKPFILGGSILRAEILGALLGIAAWRYMLSRIRRNAGILALLLMAQIVIQGLAPFVFIPFTGLFSIIPFGGFLRGITAGNVLQFTEKVFFYGAFLWLLIKTGLSLRFSVIFSVALLAGIEIMQMFISGGVAEITNPLLAVILGLFLYFLDLRDESP